MEISFPFLSPAGLIAELMEYRRSRRCWQPVRQRTVDSETQSINQIIKTVKACFYASLNGSRDILGTSDVSFSERCGESVCSKAHRMNY